MKPCIRSLAPTPTDTFCSLSISITCVCRYTHISIYTYINVRLSSVEQHHHMTTHTLSHMTRETLWDMTSCLDSLRLYENLWDMTTHSVYRHGERECMSGTRLKTIYVCYITRYSFYVCCITHILCVLHHVGGCRKPFFCGDDAGEAPPRPLFATNAKFAPVWRKWICVLCVCKEERRVPTLSYQTRPFLMCVSVCVCVYVCVWVWVCV